MSKGGNKMGYMGTNMTEEDIRKLQGGYSAAQTQIAQTGTINGKTPNQNLAAVIQQPGNTTTATAQPYINANGVTDYHVSGQPDTGSVPPPPAAPAAPQTVQTQQTAQPVSANQASAYQPPDYAALAAARTAAALAQKKTIAEQQKASLDRSYARSNEITQDNRTLENGQINRTLNPFSGKTAYDKGIIGRERALVDETSAGNLQAQKSNIDQLLADYENATAEEQVRIADELKRADQAYNLDLAKFNQDQSNWDKTYNQNQQQIDYSQDPNNPANQGQQLQNQGQAQQIILNQYKIDDYPTEQKAAAEQIQQQLKAGKLSNDAAEYNLKQLKDPNSTYNQAAKIDLQLKQLDLKNAPEKDRLEIQQLQKQIAQIGVVHTTPQSATDIEMDQIKLETARKQLEILSGKTSATPAVPSKDSTNNLAYYQGQTDNSTHSLADKLAFAESHQSELTDADYKAWINSIKKSEE